MQYLQLQMKVKVPLLKVESGVLPVNYKNSVLNKNRKDSNEIN